MASDTRHVQERHAGGLAALVRRSILKEGCSAWKDGSLMCEETHGISLETVVLARVDRAGILLLDGELEILNVHNE